MRKIGMSSCFEPTEENFKALKDSGLSAIEVSIKWALDDLSEVKRLADKYGIALWSLHLPFIPFEEIDPSALDESKRKYTVDFFCDIIKKGVAVGIDKFVIHPSAEPIPDEERQDRIESAKKTLSELAEFAAELGAFIAVEDLPRSCLGNSIKNMDELLSANDKLKVCFDTNHMLTDDNLSFLEHFSSKIITVHISDFDFVNERHWLPGEGKTDWKKLYETFLNVGYEGAWIYEIRLECPKTIIRPRDLTFDDFYRNAREIFENKPLTVLSTPKENLGFWE